MSAHAAPQPVTLDDVTSRPAAAVTSPGLIAPQAPGQSAAGSLPDVRPKAGSRQRLMALTVLAAVIVLDQATKWWAWRHVAGAEINPGGDFLVGHKVGQWYDAPVTGALLDLLGVGLLILAVSVLVRRRRPAAVAVSGALMLGGWSSNLLDRLGLHFWTAPGSVRGAVDFIRIGSVHYNVGDFFIVAATPLFLLVVLVGGCLRWRAANRPMTVRAAAPPMRGRPRVRAPVPVLAGAALIVVAVAVGAANHGGVSSAPPHVAHGPRSAVTSAAGASAAASGPLVPQNASDRAGTATRQER
jgi:lipoprotein signal peptidase